MYAMWSELHVITKFFVNNFLDTLTKCMTAWLNLLKEHNNQNKYEMKQLKIFSKIFSQ